ncbi:MAG: hypothetical protein E7635_06725 [Ruminococcaceae bacterium]|nr:hypothetical protein [Oscillospiraceae bacterium]
MLKFDDLFYCQQTNTAIINIKEVKEICNMIDRIDDREEGVLLATLLTLSLKESFDIGYKASVSLLFGDISV